MNNKIVIDASVALKWEFKDEPDTDNAVNLLLDYKDNKVRFIVPGLFYYELANAIHIAVKRERIAEDEGDAILKDMLSIDMTVDNSVEILKIAYRNARKYNVSVYDSVHFTLAKEQGVLLYTGDRRFYNTIKDKKKFVRWIGDYRGADK